MFRVLQEPICYGTVGSFKNLENTVLTCMSNEATTRCRRHASRQRNRLVTVAVTSDTLALET